MKSVDGKTEVRLLASPAAELPRTSRFASLEEASTFFAAGSLGYSATRDEARLDGLRLRIQRWTVRPLQVEDIHSSYFSDPATFPAGSVEFDCALIMRDVPHEWRTEPDLYCDSG
jgi:hypothetical protein